MIISGLRYLSCSNPVNALFTLMDIYEGDMTKDQVPFINSVNVSAT